VLDETTPVQLLFGAFRLRLPMHGLPALAVLALLAAARARWQVKLFLFTLPSSALPIPIHARLGSTWYSLYHLAAAALALSILTGACARYMRRRRPARAG
jgi:hypothetical protein